MNTLEKHWSKIVLQKFSRTRQLESVHGNSNLHAL